MDIIVDQILAVKLDAQTIVVRELQREIREELREHATRWIESRFEDEVERWLGRKHYQRRNRRSGRKLGIACPKCNSSYQRDFMRNGRRKRFLLTLYGQLRVRLPRVVCQCGGSIPIPFTLLRRWQRVWQDVRMQVQDWAKRRMSLREMQADLAKVLETSMGLRTLNEYVHATSQLQVGERQLSTVPPVVALDGIWMTQLAAQDAERVDMNGRKRQVKRKKRRVILVALGIWPRTGRYKILDWELADGESRACWDQFLARLIQRQLWRSRGLRLFIHDGGSGLKASLKRWYWEIPSQRCVFHKLRNVYRAIAVPDDSTYSQRRALRRQVIRQAAAVFQAPSIQQARLLLTDFQEMWEEEQPEAVETMLRDQDDTLRFHTFLKANPSWKPEALRTTSCLERINRKLRRVFREAGAYHSAAGLNAAVERVLLPLLVL